MPDRQLINNYEKYLNQTINIPGYTSIVHRGEEQVVDMMINSKSESADTHRILLELVLPKGGHSGFCFKLEQAEHTVYS